MKRVTDKSRKNGQQISADSPDGQATGSAVEASEDAPVILDRGRRLSQSILWEMQRRYFEGRGIEAWRKGVVPHYITSNAFVAAVYAKMVFGFLRDCQAAYDSENRGGYDPDQAFYIIELGCGHGRFAYHFLRIFRDLHRQSVLKDISFKYIMSDSSERNVDFWRSHESLQPFLDEGLLDFACFDPRCERELKPLHVGQTLSSDTVRNPMVFIANYFFDSIPMDAFLIREGKLYESLPTITSSQEEPDPTDPEILSRMTVTYEHEPVQTDYYDNPEWNRVLSHYKDRLGDTALLFPTGALECIDNLARISRGRMLLLSADRGDCHEDALQTHRDVSIAVHGSFSLRVNYDAIGRYVTGRGGKALQPRRNPASLIVSAFLLGDYPGGHPETDQAYRGAVEEFGPDDFFTLKNAILESVDDYSLEQLLAFLKMSRWDSRIFNGCFSRFMHCAEDAAKEQKHALHAAARQVWDMYYHLGESTDVAFNIGTLLCQMRFFREALTFFGHSIDSYGHSPGTDYNMALCHVDLCEIDKALECVGRALELDAEFEPARSLRIELESMSDQGRGE